MFIGRERELASLKEFYEKDGIGMTVIYGRRRIGKSTLITEFVKDKKTIFYTATKVGKNRNLELFSKQVVDLFLPGVENISFNTIEAVFDFIDKNVKDDKLILVIDELPYWAEKDDALLSVLQKYIDTVWNDKNLKIILCGSALSFMENKVLSEKMKIKQYVLKDYMFKFWYEFIPKATSVIEIGQGEVYYTKVVKPALHSFMGVVFEDMCRYYTLKQGIKGEYGCFITSVGSWWCVENIDVVAISEIDKKAVIG